MAINMEYERIIKALKEFLPKRMYKPVGECVFEGFFTRDRLTLEEATAHEKQPIPAGTPWGEKWEYGWFFTTVTIPEEAKGERIEFMAELGECIFFVNGRASGALDRKHKLRTLTKNAVPGDTYEIAMEVYAGHSGGEDPMCRDHYRIIIPEENYQEFQESGKTQKISENGQIVVFHEDVFQLWMDIKTLHDLRNNLDDNSLRKAQIDKGLKKMCDAVDIELPFDEFIDTVKAGRAELAPLFECKNSATTPEIFAVGNSHLDLEWLWTTEETRRKTARTLGNQMQILEEYSDYKYIQSQPWILETVKNEYPDLYEEVKQAVKDGKIIVEGAAWVQPDTNIVSGESMVRQFMVGKQFIEKEFGTDSKIFWLPDSFGISGALPQIMKGCGVDYFMNAKITWLYNGGDEFPQSVFMWKGIDGTEVMSTIIQEYATMITPSAIFEKWRQNPEKEDVPVRLVPYGHGDGGGGATREHLEYLRRERDLEGMPKVKPASPNEYFECIKENYPPKNKYVGELYYASHRGSYTSQAKTKKLNRRSEYAMREAEMWSALMNNNGAKTETDKLWKTVLFNQFHDILPGTSITKTHEITEKDLAEVIEKANSVVADSIKMVLDSKADTMTVFNSLSWDRTELVELPEGYTSIEGCKTQMKDGKVFAQIRIPSCGYKSFKLGKETAEEAVSVNSFTLENSLIRAEFNSKGELVSVCDKTADMEFITKPSNVFRIYKDMPLFSDAWDIDSYYEDVELDMGDDVTVDAMYKGDLIQGLTIRRKFSKSELVQHVTLEEGNKFIKFDTEINWKETHRLLKVDFNTNIHTEELLSETQFGYASRPNHKSRAYDKDRFEVCQHKWSVLAESKRGAALINDCKYGISADGGRMSLTLLKAATEPALNADKGIQNFTYVFMPFTEAFADSDVVRKAYELNCPLYMGEGFAEEKSLLKISDSNVVIDTVKLAEDGSGDIVVRMYETKNSYAKCKLNFGFEIKKACETNMIEKNPVELQIENNSIALEFRAFEVKTVKVSL